MDSYYLERIARLEDQVATLYRHLGISPEPEVSDAVPETQPFLTPAFYDALRRGSKIQAIKLYRQTTGVGLKEAKDAVDAMVRETR
jgi:ribosomal protein L7/L12